MPAPADEVALVVDGDGRVSDYTLYTLGLMDIAHMNELVDAAEAGESYDDLIQTFSFDDVLELEYTVLAQSDLYEEDEDGIWVDSSENDDFVRSQMEGTGLVVKIVGVLSVAEDAADTDAASGIVYTSELTSYLMDKAAGSDAVQAQLANPETNVLTGEAFEDEEDGEEASDDSTTDSDTSQASVTASAAGGNANGATIMNAVYQMSS